MSSVMLSSSLASATTCEASRGRRQVCSTSAPSAAPSISGRTHHTWHQQGRGQRVVMNSSKTRKMPAPGVADNVKQLVGAPGDEVSRRFAIAMAVEADQTKCSDVVALDVAPLISWTSFMVICTVFSKPQLMATLDRMEKAALAFDGRQRQNQPGNSPWEVLDFGSVVCHVFTAQQRDHYDIESFYAACEEVELPFYGTRSADSQSMPDDEGDQPAAPSPPVWTTGLQY